MYYIKSLCIIINKIACNLSHYLIFFLHPYMSRSMLVLFIYSVDEAFFGLVFSHAVGESWSDGTILPASLLDDLSVPEVTPPGQLTGSAGNFKCGVLHADSSISWEDCDTSRAFICGYVGEPPTTGKNKLGLYAIRVCPSHLKFIVSTFR